MIPYIPKQKMNSLERRYAGQLDMMKLSGEIKDWRFEAMNFRLGDGLFYKPDFFVVKEDRFEVHEVKGGYWRDDALVKAKAAASLYPWFKWIGMTFVKNAWTKREFN